MPTVLYLLCSLGATSQLPPSVQWRETTCDIEVDAGEDVVLCNGEPGQLSGSVSGDYTNVEWTPATGLDDPTSLNPTVDVSTQTTYTLTVMGTGSNVIENGDFETGNINPSTSNLAYFNPNTFYSGPQGTYTVTSVFQVTGVPNVCDPHGGGNMMVVHGGSAGMWCQTVSVEPMTDYKFSGWFMGADFLGLISTTDVDVYINGQNIGGTGGNAVCTWNEVKGIWNSGGSSVATICIDGSGDGFSWTAIDDLELIECCVLKDEVTVFVERVEANIPFGGVVTCTNPRLMIDGGRFSKGPIVAYDWGTNDGEILDGQSDPVVTVGHKGTYNLTVTGQLGCTDETSVLVEGNTEPPPLAVDHTDLNCLSDSARIIAMGSGEELTYRWAGPDSFSSSNAIDTVDKGGVYYVSVIDKYFCTSKDSVKVNDLKTNRSYTIGIDSLSCTQDSAVLYLIGDTLLQERLWLRGGTPLADTSTLVVYDTGTVETLFTDRYGCVWRDTLHVDGDIAQPNLSVQGDSITCRRPRAVLTAQSDSLIDHFEWVLPNGTISTGDTLRTIDTGWHYVTAVPPGGCPVRDSFYVHQTVNIPTVLILGDTIDCLQPTITLQGFSSDQSLRPTWDGPGIVNRNGWLIDVDKPGSYTLNVETPEGCKVEALYQVLADTTLPDLSIAGEDLVNCQTPSVRLYPSTDSNVAYQWRVPPQSVRQGDTIITDTEGWHYLVVTGDNGCIRTDSLYVRVDTARPPFLLDKQDFTCRTGRGSIRAMPQVPGTYYWKKPGDNTYSTYDSTQSVNQEGWVYFKEVYDNTCQRIDSIYVAVDTLQPIPTVVDDTLTCGESQLALNLLIENGYEMVDWTGPNGYTSQMLHPLIDQPGDYTVTVIAANGCSGSATLHIEQIGDIPDLQIMRPDTITCIQMEADLLPQSTFNNLSYQWTYPDGSIHTDRSPVVQDTGWYTLTIQTEQGCTRTERVHVAADLSRPMLDWEVDTLTCLPVDNAIRPTGSTQGLQFDWQGPNGYSDRAANPKNTRESGLYVVAYQGDNGCVQQDTLFLPEDRTPPPLSTRDDTLDCQTGTAVLRFQSSIQSPVVRWYNSTGDSFPSGTTLSVMDTGTYLVFLEDPNNHCTSQASIRVFPPDRIRALLLDQSQDCSSPKATVQITGVEGGTAPYQYAFNGGPYQSATTWQSDPGAWVVQVRDNKGCTFEQTISVDSFVQLTADIIQEIELFQGERIQVNITTNRASNEILRYTWDPVEGLSCTNCPDPVIAPTSDTEYTIIVEDLYGCTDTIALRVKVKQSNDVFVPNTFAPASGGPNSVFKIFLPQGTDADIVDWQIFDRWGEQVDRDAGVKVSEHQGWNGRLNGRPLLPGVYVYRIVLSMSSGDLIELNGDVTLIR